MPADSIPFERKHGFDTRVICLLAILYVFTVQFGNLFRFSGEESAPGFSTLLAGGILVLGIRHIPNGVRREPILLATLLAAIWFAIANLLTGHGQSDALINVVYLTGYCLLAGVISSVGISERELRRLWLAMVLGVALSAGLTIIDYVGIVEVPFNNETVIVTDFGTVAVEQASGFFPRRSAMAAVFSISVAGALALGLNAKALIARLFYLTSSGIGATCLLLTHNRSGVISVVLSAGLYLLISPRFTLARRFQMLGVSIVLGASILYVVSEFFPQHLSVYSERVSAVYSGANTRYQRRLQSSDYSRVLLFQLSLSSLLNNPIGNGLSDISLPDGRQKNPHNIVTAIIWAGGGVGVVWLIVVSILIYRLSKRTIAVDVAAERSIYSDVTLVALAAWLLHNMSHYSLNTGVAWILFGLLLNQARRTPTPQAHTVSQDTRRLSGVGTTKQETTNARHKAQMR